MSGRKFESHSREKLLSWLGPVNQAGFNDRQEAFARDLCRHIVFGQCSWTKDARHIGTPENVSRVWKGRNTSVARTDGMPTDMARVQMSDDYVRNILALNADRGHAV